MITKAGYAVMLANFLGCLHGFNIYSGAGNYAYPTLNVGPSSSCFYYLGRTIRTESGDKVGVSFGTGNTAPTMDDYGLSGDLITTLTATSAAAREAGTGDVSIVYTLTNSGSSEITIREVAWFGYSYIKESGSWFSAMYDRTVLDTPVTIPAGGVGQVTYTICAEMPT